MANELSFIPERRVTLMCFVLSLLSPVAASSQTIRHTFAVRSYLGLCMSYGRNPGIYVSDGKAPPILASNAGNAKPRTSVRVCPSPACDAVNQTVAVEEINADREVRLWAGGSVIGITGNTIQDGVMLELQSPATTLDGMNAQTFALDGDSIILAATRNFVLKVQAARGANFTPVVLANRKLTDAEFWDFESAESAATFPTSGFVTVSDEAGFRNALSTATKNSVIVIDSHASILLTQSNSGDPANLAPPITILQDEVTIRGGRREVEGVPVFEER